MKKNVLVMLVLIGVVFAGLPALARNASPSATPSPKPAQQQVKDKIKNLLTEKHREKVRNYWGGMTHRLQVLVRNEERIAESIGKKIDRQAAKGKDVAAARAKLEEGKKLVAEAKALLAAGLAKVEEIITSKNTTNVKTALAEVRQLNKDIVAKIREAHTALVGALKELRSAKPTATPIPTQ